MNDEVNAQTFVARNVQPSQPLEFTVSGAGQLPRDTQRPRRAVRRRVTPAQAQGQATGNAGTAATDTRPGGGLGNPIDPEGTNDPWAKYKWWILGGLGLLLAAGAGVMLKRSPEARSEPVPGPQALGGHAGAHGGGSLAALKDELFSLETDRLQGRMTDAEYEEHKAALEIVLRRVLARGEGRGDVPPAAAARSSV